MKNYLITLNQDPTHFPNVNRALISPDGLLAVGGDLSPLRIISAYQQGIFPWYSANDPLLWWSPTNRATIRAGNVHISKSMRRLIKNNPYTISVNKHFDKVIHACAKPRAAQNETWITKEMSQAYIRLHQLGWAHSIEVFYLGKLVGGLYGIVIGQIFCGESMFSVMPNSSKLAFIALHQHFQSYNGQLIDCQILTTHLESLGVKETPRADFIKQLNLYNKKPLKSDCWQAQELILSTVF